jgi:hypothetical protein
VTTLRRVLRRALSMVSENFIDTVTTQAQPSWLRHSLAWLS